MDGNGNASWFDVENPGAVFGSQTKFGVCHVCTYQRTIMINYAYHDRMGAVFQLLRFGCLSSRQVIFRRLGLPLETAANSNHNMWVDVSNGGVSPKQPFKGQSVKK